MERRGSFAAALMKRPQARSAAALSTPDP